MHQTIGNMIRTFETNNITLNKNDPWGGILSAVMFATRATYHTTLKAKPMQLVFGRDAFLNTTFETNWKAIKNYKQQMIHKNNQRENSKRIQHAYKKGEKVLFKEDQKSKYGSNPYSGPYTIRKVNGNGTVVLKRELCWTSLMSD